MSSKDRKDFEGSPVLFLTHFQAPRSQSRGHRVPNVVSAHLAMQSKQTRAHTCIPGEGKGLSRGLRAGLGTCMGAARGAASREGSRLGGALNSLVSGSPAPILCSFSDHRIFWKGRDLNAAIWAGGRSGRTARQLKHLIH